MTHGILSCWASAKHLLDSIFLDSASFHISLRFWTWLFSSRGTGGLLACTPHYIFESQMPYICYPFVALRQTLLWPPTPARSSSWLVRQNPKRRCVSYASLRALFIGHCLRFCWGFLENLLLSLRGIAEAIKRHRIPIILVSHTIGCRARTLCSLAMTDSRNLLGDSKIGDVSLTLNMTMRIFGGATLVALIHDFICALNSAPQIAQRINLA